MTEKKIDIDGVIVKPNRRTKLGGLNKEYVKIIKKYT